MKQEIPNSPFATRLSGSAKETELRLYSIFRWKKKRPPALLVALSALSVLLCCNLVSCRTQQEPSAQEETELAATAPGEQIAPLKGQAISPDGLYKVCLAGRNTGVTAAGLNAPESIQICSVQTGEVLWEEQGAYTHAVSWSPESDFLVLARTGRTFCTVTVIETGSWASSAVTRPDASAIPEYTFLPEDGPWCTWLDEDTFLLTVGRGEESDGTPQKTYRCSLYGGQCYSSEQTTRILPGEYDFDHNGEPEKMEIVTVWAATETDGNIAWYELALKDANGDILWSGEANASHAGWNSYFACDLDGEDYLLQYNPTMYQGMGDYSYKLFSLNSAGNELVRRRNSVSFDINWGSPYAPHSFDVKSVADFMDDVNSLLACSKLLVSTDDSLKDLDPDAPQDHLSWLAGSDLYPGYEYDESQTLRDNLLELYRVTTQSGGAAT